MRYLEEYRLGMLGGPGRSDLLSAVGTTPGRGGGPSPGLKGFWAFVRGRLVSAGSCTGGASNASIAPAFLVAPKPRAVVFAAASELACDLPLPLDIMGFPLSSVYSVALKSPLSARGGNPRGTPRGGGAGPPAADGGGPPPGKPRGGGRAD